MLAKSQETQRELPEIKLNFGKYTKTRSKRHFNNTTI